MYATHAEGRTGDLRGQQKKQIQLAQQVRTLPRCNVNTELPSLLPCVYVFIHEMSSRVIPLVNFKMHFQMLPNYILERISKGQVYNAIAAKCLSSHMVA